MGIDACWGTSATVLPMSQPPDYYSILQVAPEATQSEIKRAFRRLVRQCHPDLNPQDPAAAARFQQISQAYSVLSDPQQRTTYDNGLAHPHREPPADNASSPANPSAQMAYLQGLDKLAQRNNVEAIKDFNQAIALRPDWAEAYLGRCQAYDNLKDDRAVLDDCYRILQLAPEMAQAYFYQGRARARLGYSKGAMDAYSQAITLDPTFALAYYRRAQAQLELQEVAAARQDLFKASELFRAQNSLSQAQRAEQLLNTLPKTVPPRVTRPTVALGSFWQIAFSRLPAILLSPGNNLLPTFARLQPQRAGKAGLLYGLMASMGGALSGAAFQHLGLPTSSLGTGLAIAIAYLCLSLCLFVARFLGRGQGSWASDLFLAGVALLPIGLALLLGAATMSIGFTKLADLWVIAGCYSTIILYLGCTQLQNIAEPYALIAVPLILFVSSKAATLMMWR
jgi:tetratricopeptide (TPR) repeat protein